MAIFKCKMCGGTIEFEQGATVGVCDSCGTKQTLPKTNDDAITNLFNRANNLRLKCEFDKAEQIYEKIVQQDDSEAEAHWGIVLCKYGIEYVDDPATGKKIPTCHRTLFDAISTDPDYLAAIDYSDPSQQEIYQSEAKTIDRIQKDIIAISQKEEPFDVFICYKETDENGKRTIDSTLANDIYYQLTQEGFKVFYAAITLEDKLGQEYEPYIFAALNSAKVMLVVGTRPEYFNAVWVKNEWSRFLKLMKADRSKLLIPCYKDMDAYELPEEFAHLQAQDMSKIGFIQDLLRGIKKVISPQKTERKLDTDISGKSTIEKLLKRAFIAVEFGEFDNANDLCEQILNDAPECAEAYLIKLLIDYRVTKESDLANHYDSIAENPNYKKIMRFGDAELKHRIEQHLNNKEFTRKKQPKKGNITNEVLSNGSSYGTYGISKKAKVFSIISGVLFILSAGIGLYDDIQSSYYSSFYLICSVLLKISFLSLGIMIIWKKERFVALSWLLIVPFYSIPTFVWALTFNVTQVLAKTSIYTAVYLLFLLFSVFQSKIFRNKLARLTLVFPLLYLLCDRLGVLAGGFSIGELLILGMTTFGMAFYLMYLMEIHKKVG